MSKSDSPLVSIIVPSYNQGAFIKETIDSILDQDYRPLEIIVIDGASTDNTIDVLKSYQNCPELQWISEPDRGVVEAVNKGFALAQGDIISIQSSDDFYLPGGIRAMVNTLQARPEVGLVFADIITVDFQGQEMYRSSFPSFTLEGFLCKEFYIPQPSAFFRRKLIETLGGWDERYFVADTELWLRMVFHTNVYKYDGYVAALRFHEGQRNKQKQTISDSYWKMVRESRDLASASSSLKKAGIAGAHINSIHYCSSRYWFVKTLHLWKAIILYPKLWNQWSGSRLLIPGYFDFLSLGSLIKRYLLRLHSKMT